MNPVATGRDVGTRLQGIDPHREPKLSMLRLFLHFPASQWRRGGMLAQD